MNAPARMRGWLLLLTVALALHPADAVAQRGPRGMPPGADRAELERRVRARFGEMIRERLGLSDEESRRLGEIMESLQADRQELMREEMALRRRVEAVLLETESDDAEARELLDRMVQLRLRETELVRRETEALLEVLTPVQILRFQAFREQLNQRIRELRGQNRPGSRRPGGPPGG